MPQASIAGRRPPYGVVTSHDESSATPTAATPRPASIVGRGPHRAVARPASGASTTSGRNSGSTAAPAADAERCCTVCRNRLSRNSRPSEPKFIAAATALATANAGLRSRPSTARTSASRSRWDPSTRSLRTVRSVPSAATSTTGTLTRNTERQPHVATNPPPSRGPAGNATLPTPAHTPIARACAAGSGNVRVMIASVPGSRSAAPTPCSTRAATSTPTVGASPHPADAAPNSASPARTTRRCPLASPSAPPTSSSAANASAYPFTTHCSPVTPTPRPAPIVGTATFSAVTSSRTRK